MKPCFHICAKCSGSIISLKRTDKGNERKPLKALIRGADKFRGQALVFLSFPILLSIFRGEIKGKERGRSIASN